MKTLSSVFRGRIIVENKKWRWLDLPYTVTEKKFMYETKNYNINKGET